MTVMEASLTNILSGIILYVTKDWKKIVSDKTVCIRVVHEQFHFLKTYTIVSKGSQEACSSAS